MMLLISECFFCFSCRFPVTFSLPFDHQVDPFDERQELGVTQRALHQACRPTGEASCFQPLAPQAVPAFFKRQHLDLRRSPVRYN